MKIVIAGGSGLIGRALAAELVGGGSEVVILSRNPERVGGLGGGITVRGWDGRTVDALAGLIGGAAAVVNLIGENIGSGRWTEVRKSLLLESRVRATRAIGEAFTSADPRPAVLGQASAVGYYGASPEGEVSEESPPGKDFLGDLCQQWEGASATVEELGVRRVVFRTGIVLSRDGGALPRMALPFKLFAGGRVGSGTQPVPWIHIADEVGAIRFLLDSEQASGPYNLTAPAVVSNQDFSRTLAATLRRPNLLPVPAFALQLALGEMSALALDGQRAVPTRLLAAGYEFRFQNVASALEEIYG